MGNITSLDRGGAGAKAYSYSGNQLQSVAGLTGTYVYDANGNATVDGRNGVALTYNHLSLPVTASKTGLNITYTYDATGAKLRKVSTQGTTTTTDYVDGIQYNNNVIDFIQTEEGIARNSGGTYTYEYNLTDHLGNVRVTFRDNNGTIVPLERTDYYAFGKRSFSRANVNRYLYNGKELQEELEQYDYGARFYDPVIARWNVVDPLADHSFDMTPYHYCSNNPMNRTDPNGMCDQPDCPHRTTVGDTPDAANAGLQIGALIVNGIRSLKTLVYSALVKTDPGMKWEAVEVFENGEYSSKMVQVPSQGAVKDMLGHAGDALNVVAPLSMLKKGGTGVMFAETQSEAMTTSEASKLIKNAIPLEDQAKKISTELNEGRNSVTVGTPDKQIRCDLAGKQHGDVPTPHTQVYNKNFVNGVQRNVSKATKHPTQMTQQEIRLIRKYLESLK